MVKEEIDEARIIIEKAKSIEDLAKCGAIKEPWRFNRNRNLITSISRDFTTKTAEFLKEKIRNIEICYNTEGTGFDVFIHLGEKKARLTYVNWDLYDGWVDPPKSCFSIDTKRFYETQREVFKVLMNLGYEWPRPSAW